MIVSLSKWVVMVFGGFFIWVGLIMLTNPQKAREILRKAGSTNLINYAEITVRIIPALALILAADISKYPAVFKVFGWFMLFTSLVLYFIPRQIHHNFSTKAADILKPFYFQLISPFAFVVGVLIIYSVV
jgi:predicted tellurium resistance membrane protein TerC